MLAELLRLLTHSSTPELLRGEQRTGVACAGGCHDIACSWCCVWQVGGFLRDRLVGSKRLISMPDRVTNAVTLSHAHLHKHTCRPRKLQEIKPKWRVHGGLGVYLRSWKLTRRALLAVCLLGG